MCLQVVYDPEGRLNRLADEVDKDAGISRLSLFSPCKVREYHSRRWNWVVFVILQATVVINLTPVSLVLCSADKCVFEDYW